MPLHLQHLAGFGASVVVDESSALQPELGLSVHVPLSVHIRTEFMSVNPPLRDLVTDLLRRNLYQLGWYELIVFPMYAIKRDVKLFNQASSCKLEK
jgi:hypothetical protein